MKVTLYMAISIDGFVAKNDDNTDWVSETDWGVFSKMVKNTGCIVMGRRTYEASGEDFPYDCQLNIVMTSDKSLKSKSKNVLFTSASPAEVLKIAGEKGFKNLLVIGGGKVNGAFLKAGLIDEVYLSVHPKILGEGIKLFEAGEIDVDLELTGIKQMSEDLAQLHYRVIRNRQL